TIPMVPSHDKLLWNHIDSGDLQLKEAYHFKIQQFQDLHWAKTIWCPDIPPSESLLAWRLMHDKVPTDENLILRVLHFTSMEDMWKLCDLNWSPQSKITITAVIINLLTTKISLRDRPYP
ncbi:ribonuclease H protein, partial [Trifolium medium]|nr:ribonuclease H protein [Trifolium medium]